MNLSPRELTVFRLVMETGSVTAAAEALRISQPAVSKTLQQTEDQLGFKLFIRQKKRLLPTSEAQALLPGAMSVYAAVEAVQNLAADLRAGRSGQLTVAATPTLAHSVVPNAIKAFREGHPNVIVNLRIHTAQTVTRLVADHHVELGILIGNVGDFQVISQEMSGRDMGCILPRGHDYTSKSVIDVTDLATEPIISISRHLPVGARMLQIFESANIAPCIAVEVSQSSIACTLANEGIGIAVLDGFAVAAARTLGMITRPFTPTVVDRPRLLRARYRPLSILAEHFATMLQAVSDTP